MTLREQLERLLDSQIKIDIILPLLEQVAKDINTINWAACINKMMNDLNELKTTIVSELKQKIRGGEK